MSPSATATVKVTTLAEAAEYFSDPIRCTMYIAAHRWPDGVVRCPTCQSSHVRFLATRNLWECSARHPRTQFSVRSGTLFEDSHISLRDWLLAIWMTANANAPLSSYQLAASLGITQKSAWFMMRRVGVALEAKGLRAPGLNQNLYGSKLRPRKVAQEAS